MKKALSVPRNALFTLLMVLLSFIASAQDKSVDVNISSDKGGGVFSSPIIWIVGIAVFVLLLVALLRKK